MNPNCLSGIEFDQCVVEQGSTHEVRDFEHADAFEIELGVTGTVNRSFDLEMIAFTPGPGEHTDQLEFWEDVYCELVGARVSGLSKRSLSAGINAVRFDRKDDLADQESYLLLSREALIGSSSDCGIVLSNHVPKPVAALRYIDRTFWLQVFPGAEDVLVEGVEVEPKTLLPLTPGMRLQFGDEAAEFNEPRQLHLDD